MLGDALFSLFVDSLGTIEDFGGYSAIVLLVFHGMITPFRCLCCRRHGQSVVRAFWQEVRLFFFDMALYLLFTVVWQLAYDFLGKQIVKEDIIAIQLVYINGMIIAIEVFIHILWYVNLRKQNRRTRSQPAGVQLTRSYRNDGLPAAVAMGGASPPGEPRASSPTPTTPPTDSLASRLRPPPSASPTAT